MTVDYKTPRNPDPIPNTTKELASREGLWNTAAKMIFTFAAASTLCTAVVGWAYIKKAVGEPDLAPDSNKTLKVGAPLVPGVARIGNKIVRDGETVTFTDGQKKITGPFWTLEKR